MSLSFGDLTKTGRRSPYASRIGISRTSRPVNSRGSRASQSDGASSRPMPSPGATASANRGPACT